DWATWWRMSTAGHAAICLPARLLEACSISAQRLLNDKAAGTEEAIAGWKGLRSDGGSSIGPECLWKA
ncbi:hypothetical protein KXX11_007944, partial [Aspergillus fumigatus]